MDCRHQSWIQLCGHPQKCSLIDPHRFATIVESLRDPDHQTLSVVTLLGRKVKNEAMRYLFPYNNTRRYRPQGLALIRADNASSLHDSPLVFADADLTFEVLPRRMSTPCHVESFMQVQWPVSDMQEVFDHVFTRVFLACSNLLMIFANDFDDLSQLARSVIRWIELGMLSDSPCKTRPRLLIVVKGTCYSHEHIRQLYYLIQTASKKKITDVFSQTSTIYLKDEHLSGTAVYRPLKEELLRQLDEHRAVLFSERWLFSASHLATLFKAYLEHVASFKSAEFSVVKTARKCCHDLTDYSRFLYPFIRFAKEKLVPYEDATSYIGSSILMNAYPHKAHRFQPDCIFDCLYAQPVYEAFDKAYDSSTLATFLTAEVKKSLRSHFEDLIANKASATELHAINIDAKQMKLVGFRTNSSCSLCLARAAQHGSCGHALCDSCAVDFGVADYSLEYRFVISPCPLCKTGKTIAKIKPPTSGVRILSIDGGGTRGMVPLEYLLMLQDTLGEECPFEELCDVAVGTSSGALIVLMIFFGNLSPKQCLQLFDTLARKLFKQPEGPVTNLVSKIQRGLNCWLSDGYYDTQAITECLQSAFSKDMPMFGNGQSGCKIAITSTSAHDSQCCIFTNYNNSSSHGQSNGYASIPHDNPLEEPLVWEVARATSAAPVYFPLAKVGKHGTYQDGALRFNNPAKLGPRVSRDLWFESCAPDLVLSLGTGKAKVESPSEAKSTEVKPLNRFRHIFSDGFVPRLCRSFLSFLDSESAWEEMLRDVEDYARVHCRLPKGAIEDYIRNHCFRLNVTLPKLPAIDDVKCMTKLRNTVRIQPDGRKTCSDIALALLTTSFFFELDNIPRFEAGQYRCQGTIRCRNNAFQVLQSFARIAGNDMDFVTGDSYLASFGGFRAICPRCHRYCVRVTFYVQDLSDSVAIYLRYNNGQKRHISGFPQSIRGFVEQQRLDAAFGSVGIVHRAECHNCHAAQKRKGTYLTVPDAVKRHCAWI